MYVIFYNIIIVIRCLLQIRKVEDCKCKVKTVEYVNFNCGSVYALLIGFSDV